jgi:hypothetical protein
MSLWQIAHAFAMLMGWHFGALEIGTGETIGDATQLAESGAVTWVVQGFFPSIPAHFTTQMRTDC